MKITFVLPGIGISGGTKAIFEFANHLVNRGHEVFLVYSFLPINLRKKLRIYKPKILLSKIKGALLNFKNKIEGVDWFDVKAKIIKVPLLSEEKYIPDADIIIATWWETAYIVKQYNETKGQKFYLVQHYEIWGGDKKLVDNSYKLGLKIIVNSTWLKNILENDLKVPVEDLIFHAPDRNHFYVESDVEFAKKKRNKEEIVRILLPFREMPWKGFQDGVEAVKMVIDKCPNIEVIIFGPEKPKSNLPFCSKFYLKPTNDQLRYLYNYCDIFVFPSWHEGFGMPPMEAMACKCAVVTTRVGAIPDYTIPNQTALVVEPRDSKGMAQNIIKLIKDVSLRNKLAENAYNHIRKFTWEKAAFELESVFKKYVK